MAHVSPTADQHASTGRTTVIGPAEERRAGALEDSRLFALAG